ncbi:phosphatidylinositol-specific phospholipase C1-like protein [Chitinophaga nivalis]|uniref:Phosphatidylinositol-specific phospholipase C1-like protein n=1 Tax=Chitinophaga nivalis TaxID=2991709 RepID=A0ABT3IH55_9BACT|nr:phosphatidylinositol-specific phospholipase C1-like protein [Chitinophaga nivalis]MCW3467004.1 phosphatidylinositol-specific phospholipase C1-like protein [Chitinophaga nivalis]MCW3483305.1 phosphatidylinositol-specific phospholipase C1-like protein [Chitinophaga nivalis]
MQTIINKALGTVLMAGAAMVCNGQTARLDALKINQVQVLGTHNSYAQPVDSNVLAYIDPIIEKMAEGYMKMMPPEQLKSMAEFHPNKMKMSEGLKYNHPPFDVQLDAGIRSLEIDVYNDPTGNRFNDPAAYRELRKKGVTNLAPFSTKDLDKPGFKVLHMADIDFRTHYTTFKAALTAMRSWSDTHPGHFPIFVMIEAKDKGMPLFPGAASVLPFDEKAFDSLDQEVVATLGRDKLIIPDDVRGQFPTLREAVQAQNWPTVKAARGKFVFLLLPSMAGMNMTSDYAKNKPNLENRVMFLQSLPTDTYAAFFLLDNAMVRKQEIQQYVQQGFFVRTRADIETYEAKVNDYNRANAAFESGAQVISTDFFRPGNGYGTPYVVKLPGGGEARPNPANAKKK